MPWCTSSLRPAGNPAKALLCMSNLSWRLQWGNKQTRLSQTLRNSTLAIPYTSNEANKDTHFYIDTYTHSSAALNPPYFPSWSSRGILDCVKGIMGQIEGWCVWDWLIDEMLSLRRVSVMMTITRGGELRQLWLLGIQIGVLTGLLLKFVFFSPHSVFHWTSSVRVW